MERTWLSLSLSISSGIRAMEYSGVLSARITPLRSVMIPLVAGISTSRIRLLSASFW